MLMMGVSPRKRRWRLGCEGSPECAAWRPAGCNLALGRAQARAAAGRRVTRERAPCASRCCGTTRGRPERVSRLPPPCRKGRQALAGRHVRTGAGAGGACPGLAAQALARQVYEGEADLGADQDDDDPLQRVRLAVLKDLQKVLRERGGVGVGQGGAGGGVSGATRAPRPMPRPLSRPCAHTTHNTHL